VQCLDLLRAVQRDAGTLEVTLQEIRAARGGNRRFDDFIARLESEFSDLGQLETRGRRLAELLALGLQGSLLVQHTPTEVADAFCASRLAGDAGLVFGTLPPTTNFAVIIERSRPKV
jgi:putative acyl-CoA dehydrogenase